MVYNWFMWCMGWLIISLECQVCGHQFVLVRPIGPDFPITCDLCFAYIAEAPLLGGDGLWVRLDPWYDERTLLEPGLRYYGRN